MDIAEFDYVLPEELIAQFPAPRRTDSRLLVYRRTSGEITHAFFRDLPDFLPSGTTFVINESRVLPARLWGRKLGGGARIETLLLESLGGPRWKVLANRAKRLRPGSRVCFAPGLEAVVEEVLPRGAFVFRFECEASLEERLESTGEMPLPPYIKRDRPQALDRERYQTVYARVPGSAAAPTAGLHFDRAMLSLLEDKGFRIVRVTLHVGLDTFTPILTRQVEEHPIHSESYEMTEEAAKALNETRALGGAILAVGTTSVRVLETLVLPDGRFRAGVGRTGLFIVPGYRMRGVDILLTNFHLPRSTLLLLIAAVVGRRAWRRLYEEAIRERYRFYSYGDAMLVLP